MPHHSSVLASLQTQLQPGQALFLSIPADIQYFTGFVFLSPEEREAFLLVTSVECVFFYAAFSPLPEDLPKSVKVVEGTNLKNVESVLTTFFQEHQVRELLLDYSDVVINELEMLKHLAETTRIGLNKLDREQIWRMRLIKQPNELVFMRQAGQIAIESFTKVSKSLKVGQTEKQVAVELEHQMRLLGADLAAFPTIVAFGTNGTLPHHQPDGTVLKKETAVLIDMGARVNGYRSDLTRSFWFGSKPSADFTTVSEIVTAAYQAGLDLASQIGSKNAAGQSTKASQIDQATRHLITEAGYGPQFIHTTGHGVGLDIHEPPSLNWANSQELLPGMVITIEPGIYLKNLFGYRYENTVVLTASGTEVLTLDSDKLAKKSSN